MARLIEVQDALALPPSVTVEEGDVLSFAATGGHVPSGAGVVELLGPFVPGLMRENGEVLSPMGAPNTVLFLARRRGRATIEVVTGDPWHAHQTTTLQITVE